MKYDRTISTPALKGPPKYSKYAPVWVGSGNNIEQNFFMTLEISADSDAHVLLKAGLKIHYEVVIGGWKNTRSEIRRGQQGLPLGQLHHHKEFLPLKGIGNFSVVTIEVQRTEKGGNIEIVFPSMSEKLKIFDKKMPQISEIRVATGFGFPGVWRVLTEEDEQKISASKFSDTPSLVFPSKTHTNDQDTPFSGVLRRPGLRTPLSENTRSPFPLWRKTDAGNTNSLASVRTVLGQFD